MLNLWFVSCIVNVLKQFFQVLQSYVTAGNACIMHKDMELLEGIVSAVGAQGPLGMCK